MKLGFSLPQLGPQATPDNLIRAATTAEDLGYDSVWVLERTLWPINPREPYPASPDGSLPEAFQYVLDPIETLAFIAARTSRIGLGTSVLVLPYHTPVILARRIATLDVLSGGRAMIGVGVGWSTDEFEAASVPFERRGARSDEILKAMINVWTRDPVSFDGKFYKIPNSRIGPKPVQKPYPPIYVAGFGQHAYDRAVKYGQGWNPAGIQDWQGLGDMIKQFRQTAEAAGKTGMEIVLRAFTVVFDKPNPAARRPMMGTLDELHEDIAKLRELGVTHLMHSPPQVGFTNDPSIETGLRLMDQLVRISR